MTLRLDKIFQPFSDLIRDLLFGFLIPGAIVFVCVFPPLFGHEIIAVLCGAVYGSWAGFSIVAVGTILGEGMSRVHTLLELSPGSEMSCGFMLISLNPIPVGTWLVFQRLLRSRSTRLETSSLNFCSLVRTMDQGSLLVCSDPRMHLEIAIVPAHAVYANIRSRSS